MAYLKIFPSFDYVNTVSIFNYQIVVARLHFLHNYIVSTLYVDIVFKSPSYTPGLHIIAVQYPFYRLKFPLFLIVRLFVNSAFSMSLPL